MEDGGGGGDGDDPNCDRSFAASGVRTWYLGPGGFCDELGFVGMRAGLSFLGVACWDYGVMDGVVRDCW